MESSGGMLAMALANACTGWLGALVWLAVGFLVLGRVHKQAGMLVGGAGVLKILAGCCMLVPDVMMRAGLYEAAETIGVVPGALAGVMRFLVFGMVIGGFALAGRELASRTGEVAS